MVKVEKNYIFQSLDGKEVSLADLFGRHKQLIVYHFMFGPDKEEGCGGCTFTAANIPDIRFLAAQNTAVTLISRGDPAKIAAYKEKNGWTFPWYSSLGSDFNYDFHVSIDESVTPLYYNYRDKKEWAERNLLDRLKGEQPGWSVFYKEGNDIYHTYSTFSRGGEKVMSTYMMLDMTPLGRNQAMPHEFPRPYQLAEVEV